MSTIIVKSGGAAGVAAWRAAFAAAAPEHVIHAWDDPAVDPTDVDFALVWEPDPGRLKTFPHLRAVLSTGAGVDHIIRDPDFPKSVPIHRMGGEETEAQMAEYVLWACLTLLHGAWRWHAGQAAQLWNTTGQRRLAKETCVGIMGLGHLGRAAAKRLIDAGFTVAGWSRSQHDVPGLAAYAGEEERAAFLARTDILVCLLPATPQTAGILNARAFRALPRGASVINVGRGAHLVEAELLAALDDGTIGAAVLDVFNHEPLPASSPLWAHPRVVITPHVASEASHLARARHTAKIIASINAGEQGELRYCPARGY